MGDERPGTQRRNDDCSSRGFIGGAMAAKRRQTRIVTEWGLIAAGILIVAALGAPGARAQEDNKPHAEVYGFVQGDYIQDFNRVNPDWQDTLRPSRIPTTDG